MLTTLIGIWALWSATSLAIALLSFLLEGTEWEMDAFWDYVPIVWVVIHLAAIIAGFTYLSVRLLLW